MDSRCESEFPHFPEEIIVEILSILPVKSLLRFKCVSPSWRRLIGSERFMKAHLQKSRENRTLVHHSIIFDEWESKIDELNQCSLYSLMNDAVPCTSPFEYPVKVPNEECCSVVGCCDGVVCIFDEIRGEVYFWNPSTRISTRLPKIDYWIDFLLGPSGFCWDESSGAYKVFVFLYQSDDTLIGRIYSSDTNAWKPMPHLDFFAVLECVTFLCGNLHLIRVMHDGGQRCVQEIVRFNLKSEVFGRIKPPRGCDNDTTASSMSLGVFGGSLSLLYLVPKTQLDVWIMKEYGVKDSWIKAMALPLLDDFLEMDEIIAILGTGPNGEILMIFGNCFLAYDPEEKVVLQIKEIEGVRSGDRVHLFFESLVSPVPKRERMLEQ